MRIAIRKIGNSRGMILPASFLAQLGLTDEAEVTIEDGAIIIRSPSQPARGGWGEASKAIAATGEDVLVMDEFANADDAELKW